MTYFSGWYLCCNVFGDFADVDESTDGIFDFDHGIWFIFLYFNVEGNCSI